ncbi:MAG: GAP family protein [Microthrixaceae bacterium]
MLLPAIGALLPFAMGVALSPIPLVAVIVVLSGPSARTTGPAFAGGWVVGLTIATTVVMLLTGAVGEASGGSTVVALLRIVLGLALVGLAVGKWRSRPGPDDEPEVPAWMDRVDSLGAGRTFLVGVGLSGANPKNLALAAAAGAAIASAGIDATGDAVAIALFVVLASTSVLGLVGLALVGGRRADRTMDAIHSFMLRNNAVIMMVVFLVLGAKVLGDGIAAL